MADWAFLADVIFKALDIEGDFNELMRKLDHERSAFAIKHLPMYQYLLRFVDSLRGGWLTSSEIADTINEGIGENRVTSSSVGRVLTKYQTEFHNLFNMELKKDTHEKVNNYRFHPESEDGTIESTSQGIEEWSEEFSKYQEKHIQEGADK